MKHILPGISIILLILVIGGSAYYFGTRSTTPVDISPTPTITVQNTGTTPILTPTPSQTKTVNAGGVLSFPAYSLGIPTGWTSQREQGQDSDKLTLTKDGYTIIISEGAFGGGGCLYPGDPPSEMAQTFTTFVEIQNLNGYVFRRSEVSGNGKSAWTICQKNSSDGSFGTPTQFGHISITGPLNPSATILAEIDAILASIKK